MSNYTIDKYSLTFRSTVHKKLSNNLIEPISNKRKELLDVIILKNKTKTNSSWFGFVYKNTPYSNSPFHVETALYSFPLLEESLHSEMETYLEILKEDFIATRAADEVILSALNVIGNMNDLYELLPESIWHLLPQKDANEPYLSKENIINFVEKNQRELEYINYLIVMKTII